MVTLIFGCVLPLVSVAISCLADNWLGVAISCLWLSVAISCLTDKEELQKKPG